jgi:hypothetical protein
VEKSRLTESETGPDSRVEASSPESAVADSRAAAKSTTSSKSAAPAESATPLRKNRSRDQGQQNEDEQSSHGNLPNQKISSLLREAQWL